MRAYDMGWSNPCPPLEHIPCWKHTSILPGTISSKRLKSLSECSFGRSQRFQPPFTQRPTPPRTYWWNNLGTTVHKASGQKTARLGFTWVMNICGLTRVHFFETNTHKLNMSKTWKFPGAQFPSRKCPFLARIFPALFFGFCERVSRSYKCVWFLCVLDFLKIKSCMNHSFPLWTTHFLVRITHFLVWINHFLVWKSHFLVWITNVLVCILFITHVLVWKNNFLAWTSPYMNDSFPCYYE